MDILTLTDALAFPSLGVVMLSGFDDGAAGGATNRLLYENSDGLLLEDSSGDLALES